MTGRNCAAATIPSHNGSPLVTVSTSHAWATCCIHVPTSEMSLAAEEQPIVAMPEGRDRAGARQAARREGRGAGHRAGSRMNVRGPVGMRVGPAIEVGEMLVEVAPTGASVLDHRVEAGSLGFERGDLAIDASAGVMDQGPAFGLVARGAEALSIALAGRLILEQLADLGEREAGVVAEASG